MHPAALLLLLIPHPAHLELDTGCPESMYSNEDSCFVLMPEPKSWYEAEWICVNTLKGHLTHIYSPSENTIIKHIMSEEDVDQVWIGISGTVEDGFSWVHSNLTAGFQFWARDQINFEGPTYGYVDRIVNFFWRRTKAEVALPFICRIAMVVPNGSPPVVWTEWLYATQCDKTCGGGKRIRMRDCNMPRHLCTNRTEDTIESVPCADAPCPSISWSEWSGWAECSATCSFGTQTRSRVTICSHGCEEPGMEKEERMCYASCPSFRDWATWHQGVSTCRFNQQWLKIDEGRVRTDELGRPLLTCRGDVTQTEAEDWSQWHLCQDGLYWRQADAGCALLSRDKREAAGCEEDEYDCMETKWAIGNQSTTLPPTTTTTTTPAPTTPVTCPSPAPAPDCDPEKVPWGPWSRCSATCNGGVTTRFRNYSLPLCRIFMKETVSCNVAQCPAWAPWDQWSNCVVNCTNPTSTQQRKRYCQFVDGENVGGDCPTDGCRSVAECKLERRNCSLTNATSVCMALTPPPAPKFNEMTTEEKVVAVVQMAVNTLGSMFIAGVCAFELIAFAIARSFTPQRQFQMGQEIMLLFAHLSLLYMVRLEEPGLVCTLLAGVLNYTFTSYFIYLAFETMHILAFKTHVIPNGTLFPLYPQHLIALGFPLAFSATCLYLLDYGDGVHGLVLKRLEATGGRILCWVDLVVPADRAPAKIYLVTYCILFAASMVTTESTAIFENLFPMPQKNTDWNRMGDAEFAYTGMYPMIFLSTLSFLATLMAFTLAVESPHNQGSTIVTGSLSLGLNIAFGCCLFFYHSFANARVRQMINSIRQKMRAVMTVLRGRRTVSPSDTEEYLDDESFSSGSLRSVASSPSHHSPSHLSPSQPSPALSHKSSTPWHKGKK